MNGHIQSFFTTLSGALLFCLSNALFSQELINNSEDDYQVPGVMEHVDDVYPNQKRPRTKAEIDNFAFYPNHTNGAVKLLHHEHKEEALFFGEGSLAELRWVYWTQGQIPIFQSLPDLQLDLYDELPNTGEYKLAFVVVGPDLFSRFEEHIPTPWDGEWFSDWKSHEAFNHFGDLDGVSLYAKLIHDLDGKERKIAFSPTIFLATQGNELVVRDEESVEEVPIITPDYDRAPAARNSTRKASKHSHVHVEKTEEVPNGA